MSDHPALLGFAEERYTSKVDYGSPMVTLATLIEALDAIGEDSLGHGDTASAVARTASSYITESFRFRFMNETGVDGIAPDDQAFREVEIDVL